MFNKRETSDDRSQAPESTKPEPPRSSATPARASSSKAVIGPSIEIDGTLRGDEDLVIEGRVKGKVELKSHSVTIGDQGNVQADIHAHTIYVDGSMDGNLVASERVVIRQSARIKGSIVSPRVSLEDGARFNGSIDMDPDSEALGKVFSGRRPASPPPAADKPPHKPNGQPPASSESAGKSSPKA
jgi:cytoskeletal protein CcmA (bactofilin family)